MKNLDPKKRQALQASGRRGGLATVRKYGREHMSTIGRAGGHALHKLYALVPMGQDDFVLVHRETGVAKARLSGQPL